MGRLNYQVGDRINPFYAVPVGTILPFAGSSIPAGWLECAGQVLSRTTYPDLFAVIGTTYGAATSETFNLPDLRGEFLRGWDNGKGVDPGRALGSAQGAKAGTINFNDVFSIPVTYNASGTPVLDRFHCEGENVVTVNDTGSGGVVNVLPGDARPRNVAVRFCIRAFGSIENSGLIDVGALAVEVSDAVKIGDFIGANQSKATSGYQKLPGGLIIQWGRVTAPAATTVTSHLFNYPIQFPNEVLILTGSRTNQLNNTNTPTIDEVFLKENNSQVRIANVCSANTYNVTYDYIAIGR